jgi:MFS family permease
MSNKLFQAVDRVLITAWVGGLWTVGYLVAPVLFHALDDRHLAGELAGRMFFIMNIVGFVCAPLLAVITIQRAGNAWRSARRLWVLVGMLLIVGISAFILQPMMQELKEIGITPGTDTAAQFGKLHGVSSILYLVLSLAGAYLVIGSSKSFSSNELN